MEANAMPLPQFRWARAGSATVGILVWTVWGILTLVAVLYIRQHSRNIPYIDDFSLVPIMAGHEPLTAQWLWSQHNEHRPVVSRLILVVLHRFIASDFRVAQYANAGLLSAMAASMIVFVRRLRRRRSVFDVAIPLSILNIGQNIGQAETLMVGFAMNLVLTIVTVVLAMLCAAAAVAVARAFSGAGGGRASRYITTTAPLFCAIYVAWLVYGSARARHVVHSVLLALIIVAIPANIRYSRDYGNEIGGVFTIVLRAMNTRSTISAAVKKAWPVLHPNQKIIDESFKLLKEARVGQFGKLEHENLAAFPIPATVIR